MSDLTIPGFISARQPGARPTAGRTASVSPLAALRLVLRTHLTRRALTRLNARELTDIGLTPHAALTEAARLPWDTAPGPRRHNADGVFAEIQRAWHRARTRRLLAQMNAQELRDIGVTPSDAQEEANKPFWRL